jgi:hypothetical protein
MVHMGSFGVIMDKDETLHRILCSGRWPDQQKTVWEDTEYSYAGDERDSFPGHGCWRVWTGILLSDIHAGTVFGSTIVLCPTRYFYSPTFWGKGLEGYSVMTASRATLLEVYCHSTIYIRVVCYADGDTPTTEQGHLDDS